LLRALPRPPVGALSFLIVLAAAIALAACSGGAPAGSAASGPAAAPSAGTPSDGAQAVRRIVSLAPNITEILFALGLGERVVGVTEFCNYPPEALRLPKVGGFVNPNAEVILALHPDLVVATPNVGNRTFVERLIAVGARVEVVQARNVEEIDPAITAIANAAGDPGAGSALIARLHAGPGSREGARRVAAAPARRSSASRSSRSSSPAAARIPVI
jgi:iron complex transport system substrate-binding protein